MKTNILLPVSLLAILSACSNEELTTENITALPSPEFTAQTDIFDSPSRTSLHVGKNANDILWQESDAISIFRQSTAPSRYQLTEGQGTTQGKFTFARASSPTAGSTNLQHNVAIYPYRTDYSIAPANATSYTIQGVEIPSQQTYTASSFTPEAYPMAAVSDNTVLTFKNLSGMLNLQFTGTATLHSITLSGNYHEVLAGKASVSINTTDRLPRITMAPEGSTTVTLQCGPTGVKLSDTPTAFYFALPPTSWTKGFTVTATDTEGGSFTLTARAHEQNNIRRNYIVNMPPLVYTGKKQLPNNEIWVKTADGLKPSITPKGFTVLDEQKFGYWILKNTKDVKKLPQKAFQKLTTLTEIVLPDCCTTIGNHAFDGCSSLSTITWPLQLTKLGQSAFANCTQMATVELPKNLGEIGQYAFANCTQMATVELPQNLNVIGQYAFQGCTSLTSLTIPAKVTIIQPCIANNCTALTKVIMLAPPTNFQTPGEIEQYAFRGIPDATVLYIDKVVWESHIYEKTCMFHTWSNIKDLKELH